MRVDKLTLAALEATLTGPDAARGRRLSRARPGRPDAPRPARSPTPLGRTWPRRCRPRPRSAAAARPASSLPSAAVVAAAAAGGPAARRRPAGGRARRRRPAAARPAHGARVDLDDALVDAVRRAADRAPEVHVVATAGHVDHGKSTLVRALTGQDPDRLEEEHRRGLSIELGYCWTDARPGRGDVAFVDVPGHERFLSTTLAGLGPVPVALLVVAADDPWMPQAAEHLAALDALGVRHGVAGGHPLRPGRPGAALARAAGRGRPHVAGRRPAVAVSGRTGAGPRRPAHGARDGAARVPAPDPSADVRLWVDRRFHVARRRHRGDRHAAGRHGARRRRARARRRRASGCAGWSRSGATGDDVSGAGSGGARPRRPRPRPASVGARRW